MVIHVGHFQLSKMLLKTCKTITSLKPAPGVSSVRSFTIHVHYTVHTITYTVHIHIPYMTLYVPDQRAFELLVVWSLLVYFFLYL